MSIAKASIYHRARLINTDTLSLSEQLRVEPSQWLNCELWQCRGLQISPWVARLTSLSHPAATISFLGLSSVFNTDTESSIIFKRGSFTHQPKPVFNGVIASLNSPPYKNTEYQDIEVLDDAYWEQNSSTCVVEIAREEDHEFLAKWRASG